MASGRVVSIHVCTQGSECMQSVPEVRAVVGKGIEGDRYFKEAGTFSKKKGPDREVTLIESEAIEALRRDYEMEIAPGDARRNIVTRNVALNHLVGCTFQVGEATLKGLRLCEPCGHLARLTCEKAEKGLVHRGGLRAQVVKGGSVRAGDVVKWERTGEP